MVFTHEREPTRPLAFTCLYLGVTSSHPDHLQVSLTSARPGYAMHRNSLHAFSPLGLCFSYHLFLPVKILSQSQDPLVLLFSWCFCLHVWPPTPTRNKCLRWNPPFVRGNNIICLYLSGLYTCLLSHSRKYISQRWWFHHLLSLTPSFFPPIP